MNSMRNNLVGFLKVPKLQGLILSTNGRLYPKDRAYYLTIKHQMALLMTKVFNKQSTYSLNDIILLFIFVFLKKSVSHINNGCQ